MRKVGFGAIWGVLALLASVPLWLTLPQPPLPPVTHAERLAEHGWEPVSLPQARRRSGGWEHYRIELDLDAGVRHYLYLPTISQRAVISLRGEEVADTEHRSTMMGLASGVTALVPLPPNLVQQGRNVLDIRVQSLSLVPSYLSELYVGDVGRLAPHYRNRVFLLEYLRLMVPAGQLLMALVVLVLWLYRPREQLFGWLSVLLVSSMFIYLGMLRDMMPWLVEALPYMHMVGSAAGIAMVVSSLIICRIAPPRWLQWLALVLPVTCLLLGSAGLVSATRLVIFVNAPVNILGLLTSLVIVSWGALTRRGAEPWLLLLPLLLATVSALYDFGVVMARLDGPVLLSVYYRPALMIGIAMILMRRLGISLNKLDDVNAMLSARLAQRERELARLYEEERREAAARVRSEERQRLTRDLHDGLSGHLVSIIALAERNHEHIERSAREALDDLRLVIHSLDISDDELPVVLSGLRDRLARQLKRLGIELDWSIARLPAIRNVTPTQALNILRILQEAVTNAVRHASPTRITVRGESDADGHPVIVVENDGTPFPLAGQGRGKGLENMRRRIHQLQGEVRIEPLSHGTRLSVHLPAQLPETPVVAP